VPETICAVADSIRWAEEIMEEIDRRHPVGAYSAARAARHLKTADDLFGGRREPPELGASLTPCLTTERFY
jgi:hypothetical protein